MVNILYEDNHLLVVEKPVNVLSQADDTGDPDMLSILKKYIGDKYNKPGEVYLGLVHRLDRPVGGVMVFARTSKAASRLSQQIREGKFKKSYLAVVNGQFEKAEATLEHYLEKDESRNVTSVVSANSGRGKRSELSYVVLEVYADKGGMQATQSQATQKLLTLLKVDLHTGRSHQIRVQFSEIGHPLWGDQKYGNSPKGQLALWSAEITFSHPTKNETLTFKSNPPDTNPWSLFDKPVDSI